MPKTLEDGTRNAYRIVRLKDKLGSKSMASGEIGFEGAVAYQLGELDQGLKQMLEMVNSSRVSHLARAAGMMRRCLNEALLAARNRNAFGHAVIDHPLMRRQLLKLMVPTEQALSALMYAAAVVRNAADSRAKILRIMTPIAKYRACRDNVTVATASMEARGGNGYIEDWPNARLVRDAHLGVIWEGTSNINALDAMQRAVGKERAHWRCARICAPLAARRACQASSGRAWKAAWQVLTALPRRSPHRARTNASAARRGQALSRHDRGPLAPRGALGRCSGEPGACCWRDSCWSIACTRAGRRASMRCAGRTRRRWLLSDEPVSLDAAAALLVA